MAYSAIAVDPHNLRTFDMEQNGHLGPPPKRIVTGYGFWIFLLSDMVMFACFFAAYAVLVGQTAGGPAGAELFDLQNVAIETGCLLLSSFTCGLASIAAGASKTNIVANLAGIVQHSITEEPRGAKRSCPKG